MKKKTAVKSGQTKTPASIFEKQLDSLQYHKIKLNKSSLAKAIEDGEGLFNLETVYESVFSGGSSGIVPEDAREKVLLFIDKIKELYKRDYTEDDLKEIYATGLIKEIPPRIAMTVGGKGIPEWKSAEKAYTLAYGFKISLLRKELEDALEKNDLYRACYCCINICGLWHQLKMLPLNEPVRQMAARNKELRWKKRKIPARATDAKGIVDFYNKEKNTFEKQNKTTRGSSKDALISTCEKFKLGQTSIKKVLKTYNRKIPVSSTELLEVSIGRK